MSIIIKKSVLVEDYSQYHWLEQHGNVKYHDIINYERAGVKGEHHCVMCGLIKGLQCEIPNQNKDVCKICDCSYWRILNGNIIVKFCKGKLIISSYYYFLIIFYFLLIFYISLKVAKNFQCYLNLKINLKLQNVQNVVKG